MRNIAVKEKFKKGETIIKEGGFSEGTYVILSGRVEVVKIIGEERVVVTTLEKGDVFGEMSFLEKEPRSAFIVALEDVEVGIIDKDFLDNELNKTSEDFRTILTQLAARLRKTSCELVKLKTEHCGK